MRVTDISPATGRRQRHRAAGVLAGAARAARALVAAAATSALAACEFITGVPGVDYVEVTVTPTTIQAGGQAAQAVGIPFRDDGSEITHNRRRVKLSSSNSAILTVAGSGTAVVTGVAPGQAWVIGESDGKRDSVQVTVTPPLPPVIQFNPTFPSVRVGGTAQVAVIPLNNAGQPFPTFTLQCQSSTPGVLTAAAAGQSCAIQGVAQGQATLSVIVNGGANATVTVTVSLEPYTRIEASVRPVVRINERVPLDIRLLRADGSALPTAGRQLTYTSSNVTVAVVDNGSNVLTAVGEGTATITVNGENGVVTTFPVRVTLVPVATLLLPPNPFFRVDAPNRFGVALFDSAGAQLTDIARRPIRYTPGDTSLLTITAAGIVTPKRPGRTTVTVTVDTITRTVPVTVTEVPIALLSVDSVQITRTVGQSFQYTVTALDSLSRRVTRPLPIQWFSSNPQAISIDAATGLARVLAPGVATITARLVQTDILAANREAQAAIQGVAAAARTSAIRAPAAARALPGAAPPPR